MFTVNTGALHEIYVQARVSLESPGQLLLRWDAAGFWQARVRDCVPEPQVEEHVLQPAHDVHPMAPAVEIIIKCLA